jgi:hypothetical protein
MKVPRSSVKSITIPLALTGGCLLLIILVVLLLGPKPKPRPNPVVNQPTGVLSPTPTGMILPTETAVNGMCANNKVGLSRFVMQFENLQRTRSGREIVNLFVAPITTSDLKIYNYLTGKDWRNGFRLYVIPSLNFKMEEYEVGNWENKSLTQCEVSVKEYRQYFREDTKDYGEQVEWNVYLLIEKTRNSFKVSKYYTSDDVGMADPPKYGAWYR